MLGMLKRHEVEILLKAGHPKTEVARLSSVSLRSVKRIAEGESPLSTMVSKQEKQRLRGDAETGQANQARW